MFLFLIIQYDKVRLLATVLETGCSCGWGSREHETPSARDAPQFPIYVT